MGNESFTVKRLSDVEVSKFEIKPYNGIPNSSATGKPLLIYRSVFPSSCSATQIESHLSSIGVVVPQWRYTMYSTTHFHSTTHEILCVSRGRAKLCFGGEENSDKRDIVVEKGDAMVLPAGIGHRLLEDLDVCILHRTDESSEILSDRP